MQQCTPKWPNDSLGFAMVGSGYKLLYYFGVLDGLIDNGLLDPQESFMAGVSGGAIAFLGVCAGFAPKRLQKEFERLLDIAIGDYNSTLQLFPGHGVVTKNVMRLMEFSFPENESNWRHCSEIVNIWTSILDPRDSTMNNSFPYLVDGVDSVEELHL